MKFVLFSDPHFGNTSELEGDAPFDLDEHIAFAKKMHDEKPDVLICAGDCADTCIWGSFLRDFFRVYKNPHGASLCIPGNHDLWLSSPIRKTHDQAYEDFYRTAAAEGWVGLRDKPWKIHARPSRAPNEDPEQQFYVVGNCCWYDFSTADPVINLKPNAWDLWKKWADYGMMQMKSALKMNEKLMAEFKAGLDQVPPPDKRMGLIIVTHIIGFSFLMSDQFPSPDHGRAFMGNTGIGELVSKAEPDVYYCGHSHCYKQKQLGNIDCINNGSGYGRGSKRFDIMEF